MVGPVTPARAIVRPISRSYAECLREVPVAIDVARARAQHDGYVAALRDAGIEVEVLPELADAPDAVFVEDTAVLLERLAVITRPGAESRRVEHEAIERALAGSFELRRMEAPARLDGGDVLRCDRALLVGLSHRTDGPGFAFLAAAAKADGLRTICVAVERGLHLKSACSLADDHTLLVDPGCLDIDAIARAGLDVVEVPEPLGANVLAFSDRVLVSADAPRTAELLARRGLSPRPVALDQIHAGDGALSCLSLRLAPAGAWVV
jgi:dimethylargininase